MVEFSLILPLLLVLVLAIIDFGKAFNYWNDGNQLASVGARYAVVNRKPDPANPLSLQAQLRAGADTAELRSGGTDSIPAAPQVCVDFPTGTSRIGDPVRVTMTFSYSWLPLLGLIDTPISASAVMRLEALPTNYSAGCA
jgi:hypothetical protein